MRPKPAAQASSPSHGPAAASQLPGEAQACWPGLSLLFPQFGPHQAPGLFLLHAARTRLLPRVCFFIPRLRPAGLLLSLARTWPQASQLAGSSFPACSPHMPRACHAFFPPFRPRHHMGPRLGLSLAGLLYSVACAPFFGPSAAAWPASSFICWPFLCSFCAFCFLPTWCTCQASFSFWLPKQHGLLTLVPLHANAILPCRPHVPYVKLSPAQASTREARSEC